MSLKNVDLKPKISANDVTALHSGKSNFFVRNLAEEKGKETIQAMQLIKSALDPNNIMNPGKIF